MRPRSIRLFEWFFLAGLAATAVSAGLSFEALSGDPRLAALGDPATVAIAGLAVNVAVFALLWYLIARRASNVAKWVYVALTAFALLMFVQALATRPLPVGPVALFDTLGLALQIVAAWLLFKPDAKAWLEGDGADAGSRGPIV